MWYRKGKTWRLFRLLLTIKPEVNQLICIIYGYLNYSHAISVEVTQKFLRFRHQNKAMLNSTGAQIIYFSCAMRFVYSEFQRWICIYRVWLFIFPDLLKRWQALQLVWNFFKLNSGVERSTRTVPAENWLEIAENPAEVWGKLFGKCTPSPRCSYERSVSVFSDISRSGLYK